MENNQSNILIIDAGNTSIKMALFNRGELLFGERTTADELLSFLQEKEYDPASSCVLSTVASNQVEEILIEYFDTLVKINSSSIFPFKNNYKSETLGIDRACNAAALAKMNPGKNSVAIDIGTCVKFDFVDENGSYHGGSISPGIHLRYKSLNDYTAKLPLLNSTEKVELVGDTTELSIQSGVINGMQGEINAMIRQYENKFPDLTFFVTGGDANYFDFEGKNNIFANENLTLWGIYYVYQQNVQ